MQEQSFDNNIEFKEKEILINCSKCGRPLSSPISIERGYGPKCWEYHYKVKIRFSPYVPA